MKLSFVNSCHMDFISIINISALINKLLFFLINVVGLQLILWAYAANRRTRPGRLFLAGVFYILLWIDIDFVSAQAGVLFPFEAAQNVALWAFRGVLALLAMFFAMFYSFSLNFPAANPLNELQRQKNNLNIALWTFLFIVSFTPLVIEEAALDPSLMVAVWIKAGPLFWFYAVSAALALALSFWEMSRNRRLADAQNRQKGRLIVLSAAVFGSFNLIFNIIGPALGELWGYIGFFAIFADYVIAILLGYIIYHAARDKLFGIKIILVEVFVGLMGASLLVMPIFVEFLWQQALLIVLFVLFCIFGYVLVQSTIKEYREKEMLEQKVAQRTQELERVRLNLEEMNAVLEVRVQARTKELEGLNQTLEEKVIERTNDLELKIKDLGIFQRITVGRELKMIELKEEIERLRARLGGDGKKQDDTVEKLPNSRSL